MIYVNTCHSDERHAGGEDAEDILTKLAKGFGGEISGTGSGYGGRDINFTFKVDEQAHKFRLAMQSKYPKVKVNFEATYLDETFEQLQAKVAGKAHLVVVEMPESFRATRALQELCFNKAHTYGLRVLGTLEDNSDLLVIEVRGGVGAEAAEAFRQDILAVRPRAKVAIIDKGVRSRGR